MPIRGEQTISATTRFTVLGREFAIEATFLADGNSINVGLYDNGRLIFSATEPALDMVGASDFESALENVAATLEAQVQEMFSHLQAVEEGGSFQIARLLADVFESRGIYDEAERLYALAVDLNPVDAESLYRHALCLTHMGEYGRACERLSEAVSQKPLFADYRNAYGLALAWAGKSAESRKQLENALELNTYYADAYYSMGLVCLFNGIKSIDREFAQEFVTHSRGYFEKATLIDESFQSQEHQLGASSLESGSVREAFSYYKKNRDAVVSSKASSYEDRRTSFLATLQSSGKLEITAQIELLRRQLEENPQYVDVSFQLALAYMKSGICEWKAGIEQLKAVLELNPELYKAINAHDISYGLLEELENATKNMESGSKE